MLRKILILSVIHCCAAVLLATGNADLAQAAEWDSTYGGANDDWGQCVQQTSDGGYIIVGTTQCSGAAGKEIYLVKTNSSGQTSWTQTYTRRGDDYGESVEQTTDGGYFIVGSTSTNGGDVFAIKTDDSGTVEWTETCGGIYSESGHFGREISSGGYIVTGRTYSYGPGTPSFNNVYLVKIDTLGNTVWDTAYGKDRMDGAYCVDETYDGGFIMTGWTAMSDFRCYDVYLLRVDSDGDSLWARNYGHPDSFAYDDWGEWVEETADSGFIITGHNSSYKRSGYDVWLIKTDKDGDTCWSRTFGGSGGDAGYSVKQCSDTGYVVAGTAGSGIGPGGSDVFLIKTDKSGSTDWIRAFGGNSGDVGRAVDQTSGGDYVVGGFTNSFGAGGCDFYLNFRETPGYVCGDADSSGSVDVGDFVYLINYLNHGGPAPKPLDAGDPDCSGAVDSDDLDYLGDYLFSYGPEPCCP